VIGFCAISLCEPALRASGRRLAAKFDQAGFVRMPELLTATEVAFSDPVRRIVLRGG
jgi:hypothetical protein